MVDRDTYLDVAADLKRRLPEFESGWLPKEAEIGRDYGISRTTVRRALKALGHQKLISSVPGVGWHRGTSPPEMPLSERLIQIIAEDNLQVGDPYPSEHALSARLGAARPSVRKALVTLENAGYLTVMIGKGRRVVKLS